MKYVNKREAYISHYSDIEKQLIEYSEYFMCGEKCLMFTPKVETMKLLEEMSIKLGLTPICIWSEAYKIPMDEEQLKVRQHLLEHGELLEPYNVLIINRATETGVNIYDEDMNLMICHTTNPTQQVQSRGRIRHNIDLLVLQTKDTKKLGFAIDEKLLDIWLTKDSIIEFVITKNKMSTFIRNARKLAKATDDDFVIVETDKKGEIIYRLGKNDGKYVLIERRMLEVLIKCTNSDMLKAYVFFKWRLRNGGGIVSRKELADYLGYCVNNNRKLHDLSKDIETTLVKMGLIRKELITVPSYDGDNEYNSSCYYELVPYCEWIEFWNNGHNAVEFKEKL